MSHTDVRTVQYRSGMFESYQRQLDAIVAELPTTHDALHPQVSDRTSYDLDRNEDVLHTDAYMIRMYRPLERTRFTDTLFGEVMSDLVVLKDALLAFVSRCVRIAAERVRNTLERTGRGDGTCDVTRACLPIEMVPVDKTFTPIRMAIVDHGSGVTDMSRRIRSVSRSVCVIAPSHTHGVVTKGYRSRFSMFLEACSITLDWIVGNAEMDRDQRPAQFRDAVDQVRGGRTIAHTVHSLNMA